MSSYSKFDRKPEEQLTNGLNLIDEAFKFMKRNYESELKRQEIACSQRVAQLEQQVEILQRTLDEATASLSQNQKVLADRTNDLAVLQAQNEKQQKIITQVMKTVTVVPQDLSVDNDWKKPPLSVESAIIGTPGERRSSHFGDGFDSDMVQHHHTDKENMRELIDKVKEVLSFKEFKHFVKVVVAPLNNSDISVDEGISRARQIFGDSHREVLQEFEEHACNLIRRNTKGDSKMLKS